MTESEAKGFVQGKLDCMKKCDVFNKEDKHRNNECELCEYCYSQGTFGEQKEAFSVAINALEKQIEKKPYKDNENGVYEKYHCPTCHRSLFPNDHHCKCGQVIDWSDEE